MSDTKKLLFAAIVLTSVYCGVSAKEVDEIAVDLYNRCREKDLQEITDSGLLEKDINSRGTLKKHWEEYSTCSKQITRGLRAHDVALAICANDNYLDCNNNSRAVLVDGSTYDSPSDLTSLHFLLMDALVLLKSQDCRTKFIVTEKTVEPKKNSLVRFKTFHTAYQDLKSTDTDLESMTVLSINTCFFADLGAAGCVIDKRMALLSPAEQFVVEDVQKKSVAGDDADYTEVVLRHSKVLSFHNCSSTSGSPAEVSTQWLVSLPVALSLSFFHC